MTDSEHKALRQIIFDRLHVIYKQLKYDVQYQEVCEQQRKSEAEAEALLHKLEKSERITIRNHYEGEVNKANIELEEAYIQGLRDCVQALIFLGVLDVGGSLGGCEK